RSSSSDNGAATLTSGLARYAGNGSPSASGSRRIRTNHGTNEPKYRASNMAYPGSRFSPWNTGVTARRAVYSTRPAVNHDGSAVVSTASDQLRLAIARALAISGAIDVDVDHQGVGASTVTDGSVAPDRRHGGSTSVIEA